MNPKKDASLFARHVTLYPPLLVKLNPAIGGQRGTHALPGAQQAGFGRGKRKSMYSGVVLLFHAIQVALFDNVAIFRSKLRQHASDAGAERHHRIGLFNDMRNVVRQLDGLAMQTLIIDQRIARYQIQPGALVIQIAESAALAHRLDEHILQQIFGQIWVRNAMLQVVTQFAFVRAPGIDHAGKLHGQNSSW